MPEHQQHRTSDTEMDEDISFELLAQQYGLDPLENVDGLDNVEYRDPKATQVGDQILLGQSIERSWNPSTIPVPPFMARQAPQSGQDDAVLASHFDFDRAEAAGLLAASSRFPTPSTDSTSLAVLRDSTTAQATSNFGGERRTVESALSRQQQDGMFVEPEPGKRIRLVPVTSLRK